MKAKILITILIPFFLFSCAPVVKAPTLPEPVEENPVIVEPEETIEEPEVTVEQESPLELLSESIKDYIKENNINSSMIAYTITDLETKESVSFNQKKEFIAASIYKLPLAMLFYDEIEKGNFSLDTLLVFEPHHFQEGGILADNYEFGSVFTIDQLLTYMIEFSDNSAAEVLNYYYGGWERQRTDAMKYSKHTLNPHFLDLENYMTTQYTNDLLLHIYNNPKRYELLIEDMENSFPYEYLNLKNEHPTAQKTAQYLGNVHAVGISDHYCISIFTKQQKNAYEIIGDLNLLTFEILHPLE